MLRDYLKSKSFVTFGVILLLVMGYLFSKELNRRYRISREIGALNEEIAKYSDKNQELSQLIDYLETPEYQERQARPLLNLQKPGEFAVAFPPSAVEEQDSMGAVPSESAVSNYRQWCDYFFSSKVK